MKIETCEYLTLAECQQPGCYAVWTVTSTGVPPSQRVCGHAQVLYRSFVANGPVMAEEEATQC